MLILYIMNISRTLCLIPKRSYICYPATKKYLAFHKEKLEEEYTHTLDYLYNPNKEKFSKQFNYSSPYPDESKLSENVNYIGSDDDLVVFRGIPKNFEKDKFIKPKPPVCL